ncbi:MAG: T9SS type A sorting domain-containing protein [Bacteroidetes bacterium]|nr:T9SS type A sorting domain-containing protein [Bacteroidota bacterium]
MGLHHHLSFLPIRRTCCGLLAILALSVSLAHAQKSPVVRSKYSMMLPNALDGTTSNKFVFGRVSQSDGTIWVQLPDGNPNYVGYLNYREQCFFSAKVIDRVFTNNPYVSGAANTYSLNSPDTLIKNADTVRAVWTNRNGADIIQEIWPYAFERAGQIVMRWSFRNRNPSVPISVQCQWLNDVELDDPNDTLYLKVPHLGHKIRHSNDGPTILTNVSYRDRSQQWTNAGTMPWMYMAFLFDLAEQPGRPALTSLGYLDNKELGTTKPLRVTIGDWPTLSTSAWGVAPGHLIGPVLGPDDAVLIEFIPTQAGSGITVGGVTSYGTSDFEICHGTMFGLLKYKEFLPLDKTRQAYDPTPVRIDFLPVNDTTFTSDSLRFSLTVGPHLSLCDAANTISYGTTQLLPIETQPPLRMAPGDVDELVWWAKASPVYFCKDTFVSELKIAATGGIDGHPPYHSDFDVNVDTCEHPIRLECAETDTLPPLHDVLAATTVPGTMTITVHDDRKTPILDRGLDTVWWQPDRNTVPYVSNFSIALLDSIRPCYADTLKHRIVFTQRDSTIGGCFTFFFLDCMGNLSDTELCFTPHLPPTPPDTLPPIIKIIEQFGQTDDRPCSVKIDSVLASEVRNHDRKIDSVYVLGSPNNMAMNPRFQHFANPVPVARFGVHVLDSMHDGDICIRVVDAATPPNHTDTCFRYCTTPDTLAPLVKISPVTLVKWQWQVDVDESRPWDRLIDTIFVYYDPAKFTFPPTLQPPQPSVTKGLNHYTFIVQAIDTSGTASFCVRANDLAGNMSDTVCTGFEAEPDILAPNIVFEHNPNVNAPSMEFGINDIHLVGPPPYTTRYVWDRGVDSVWFTNVRGITIPWMSVKVACIDSLPHFVLSVTDTVALDTLPACVTINALDCAGNLATQDWCYRYNRDAHAPKIVAHYLDRRRIQVTVTDSALYDRGNGTVSTSGEVNIDPIAATPTAEAVSTLILQRPLVGQSSHASVSALDRWGSVFLADMPTHTAEAPIDVRIQDLALGRSEVVRHNTELDIPVRFVQNDATDVMRKDITSFLFSFTIQPQSLGLKFIGVTTAGTATANGWQVDTLTKGISSVIMAQQLPGGSALSSPPDTLLFLRFAAIGSDTTEVVRISVDQINGETVIYNGGRDTTINGLNSVSIMPPPWGSLSGTQIVIASTCAPILGADSTLATRISLDEPSPNPANATAHIHYTLAQTGPVQIGIFDMLGREIRRITDRTQVQGSYDISVSIDDIGAGQYIIRLATQDGVLTRLFVIRR